LEESYLRNKKENGNLLYFIKDNAASQKKLWDIWQRTTSYSESLNKIETIPIKCHKKVQNLDNLWESQIFLRTIQAQ